MVEAPKKRQIRIEDVSAISGPRTTIRVQDPKRTPPKVTITSIPMPGESFEGRRLEALPTHLNIPTSQAQKRPVTVVDAAEKMRAINLKKILAAHEKHGILPPKLASRLRQLERESGK